MCHILISLDFTLRVEGLIDDEVEVSFKRMSVYARVVVAVSVKQVRKVCHGLGQILHMEGHILDEACGARKAESHLAHRSKKFPKTGPALAAEWVRNISRSISNLIVEPIINQHSTY